MYIEIIFYANGHGCRKNPPNLNDGNYRPHLVIKGRDEYLGVVFIDGENAVLGKNILAEVKCLYEGIDYEPLEPGISFFIMEGANKVGEGKVIERWKA